MSRSTQMPSSILLAILVAGLMIIVLAFAPMAFARGGSGGGGGGRGFGGGGGSHGAGIGRGFGGGGGGRSFSAPSMRSAPSGSFGRSMPSYSAPRSSGFSAPRSPNYSYQGSQGRFGSPAGGRSGFSSPSFQRQAPMSNRSGGFGSRSQMGTPSRIAPSTGASTGRGPSSSVNTPTGRGFNRSGNAPGTRNNPANITGAGPSTGQTGGTQGGGFTPRTPGQYRSGRYGANQGAITSPGATGQPGGSIRTPGQAPGATTGQTNRGGRGRIGNQNQAGQPGQITGTPGQTPGTTTGRGGRGGRGFNEQGGRGRGPGAEGYRPDQTRQQWDQNRRNHHGDWHHEGNWNHDDHWDWNDSHFSFGLFFYPGFAVGFNYGYWGFDYCGAYCTYSPFYYYGLPYVYAPRAVVTEVPVYTYAPVPDYSYGNSYYLSQGSYSGLNSVLDDIRNGWVEGRADLITRHIDTGTQVAIYLDNNSAYSLSGTDYGNMVDDAAKSIRTVSFTINNVEQRSDGAYTVLSTHEFYDVNNVHKVVDVSYTLALKGGRWVIVATGSTGS